MEYEMPTDRTAMDLYIVQPRPTGAPFATTMPSDEFAARAYPTGQWINVSALQRRLEALEGGKPAVINNSDHPADCLGDCCVRLIRGQLYYRDGVTRIAAAKINDFEARP